MNADGKGLFAAICADPEDDISRLVYADWLDENGDEPRAEALRMSVERRRLPDWEPRAWVLDARRDRLHERHRKDWDAELPKLVDGGWSTGQSGLVEHVRLDSPRSLLEQEEVIFSTGPIGSLYVNLGLGDEPDDAAPLASCPAMARVQTLALVGMVPHTALALPTLAASPCFSNLRHLKREMCGDEDDFLEYLADCPPFPNLESLTLYRAYFEPGGCEALSRSPLLRTLRRLNICQAISNDAGLRHLMRSPHFGQLRDVRLSENNLTPRPFKSFFALDWQHLEHLDLSSNSLSAATVRHLVQCPRMSGLRWLDLSASLRPFGDTSGKVLARSPHLERLRVLDFGFNFLTHVGLDALAHADWASNLTRLNLTGTDMGQRELAALASPTFGNLRWLDLWYGKITDAEIPRLLEIPWLNQLTHLNLMNNEIGYEGARLLAEAPLDAIEHLDLRANKIAEPERELLRECFGDRVRFVNSWDK
jgi:uncharacterized protein (TIGR02996 family)